MSFSKIKPDIIIKYDFNTKESFIIYPKEYAKKIFLFEEVDIPIYLGKIEIGRKFTDIKEIVSIVPKIKKSYPFIKPQIKNDKYYYRGWQPMITEKMNSWWL